MIQSVTYFRSACVIKRQIGHTGQHVTFVWTDNALTASSEQQQIALPWGCWWNQYWEGEKFSCIIEIIAARMAFLEIVGDNRSCGSPYALGPITVSKVENHCPSEMDLQATDCWKHSKHASHGSQFRSKSPILPTKVTIYLLSCWTSHPPGPLLFCRETFSPCLPWIPSAGCRLTLQATDSPRPLNNTWCIKSAFCESVDACLLNAFFLHSMGWIPFLVIFA